MDNKLSLLVNNNKLLFDINVLNDTINLKIYENSFVGKGAYGHVYYIDKINDLQCVIKIGQTDRNSFNFNYYETEAYFYCKYNSSENNTNCLPKLIDLGKTKNKVNAVYYDYLILEYVGALNLNTLFNNVICPSESDRCVMKILYNSAFINLSSIHSHNIIYRDISPNNLVISNDVAKYFTETNSFLKYKISQNISPHIEGNYKFEDIVSKYFNDKHNELIKFIDAGLCCDIDQINYDSEKNIIDNFNDLFCCVYDEFDELDGMFCSIIEYCSPFCLFNFSSILKNDTLRKDPATKLLISNLLKISDIWSFNIIFSINLYNILRKGCYYFYTINKKKLANPRIYGKKLSANTFIRMPFSCNEYMYLSNELMFVEKFNFSDEYKDNYEDLRNHIMSMLNKILSFINSIISISEQNKWRFLISFSKDNIIHLSNYSSICLQELQQTGKKYHEKIKNDMSLYL